MHHAGGGGVGYSLTRLLTHSWIALHCTARNRIGSCLEPYFADSLTYLLTHSLAHSLTGSHSGGHRSLKGERVCVCVCVY